MLGPRSFSSYSSTYRIKAIPRYAIISTQNGRSAVPYLMTIFPQVEPTVGGVGQSNVLLVHESRLLLLGARRRENIVDRETLGHDERDGKVQFTHEVVVTKAKC